MMGNISKKTVLLLLLTLLLIATLGKQIFDFIQFSKSTIAKGYTYIPFLGTITFILVAGVPAIIYYYKKERNISNSIGFGTMCFFGIIFLVGAICWLGLKITR